MQVVGRLCEGCGEAVTKMGAGDGCGSCDVVVCAKCLKGTARCPSCQRPFDETRDAAPRAERKGDATLDRGRRQAVAIAVTLVGAVVLAVILGWSMAMAALYLFANALLLLQLFRGRAWARWILFALTVLNAVAYGHFGSTHFEAAGSVPSLALAAIYAWCAAILAMSKPLDRFVRTQRLKNP